MRERGGGTGLVGWKGGKGVRKSGTRGKVCGSSRHLDAGDKKGDQLNKRKGGREGKEAIRREEI